MEVAVAERASAANGTHALAPSATLALRGWLLVATELVTQCWLSVWEQATYYNLKMMLIYMPTIVYVYTFMKSLYCSAHQKCRRKMQQIDDLQQQLQQLDGLLSRHRAACARKSAEVELRTERFVRLRRRVRELVASARTTLHDHAIWDDAIVGNGGGGGDDAKTVAELLQKLNYEPTVPTDKAKASEPDELFHSTSSRSSGDTTAAETAGLHARRERVHVVNVTNVYRLHGARHLSRQTRPKRIEARTLLKKRTENVKKLLLNWNQSLSSIIDKKLTDPKPVAGSATGARDSFADDGDYDSKTMLVPTTERQIVGTGYDAYKRMCSESNSSGSDSLQDDVDYYGQSWSELRRRSESLTLLEVDVQPPPPPTPQCECSGPHGSNVLFILPEETRSQIEISEI